MSLRTKSLTIALAALGTLAAVSQARADVTVNGLIWSTPRVVSGSNARSQAYSIAAQKGGRLPTWQELQAASPMLRKYSGFNRQFHVCFTDTPGQQWSIYHNKAHNDGGKYYGFDMVTVVRPAGGGFNQGGFNQGGYNQGGFNQGGYNQGGYNQGGYNQGGGYGNGFPGHDTAFPSGGWLGQ